MSQLALDQKPAKQRMKTSEFAKWKRYAPLFIMVLPGVLYMLFNNYLPMLGLVIAFKDINYTKGILGSDWTGLKNFEFLFRTSDAFTITRNTILYNGGFIVINTLIAITVAILLNGLKNRFASRVYQSVILLPYLISTVVVGYLVFALLSMDSGLMNRTILPALGLDPIMWYNEPKFWPYILTIVHTWKEAGYLCVIYLAAVLGIDKEFYEAAKIDGANTRKQVLHITLPMIMPVIIIMTLLSIGKIFYADFGLFYQVPLNSGILSSTTDVIDTYVYRSLLNLGDIGMASAAGFYQSIVGFVLVIAANMLVRKISRDSALF